jgi:hypothetical protein
MVAIKLQSTDTSIGKNHPRDWPARFHSILKDHLVYETIQCTVRCPVGALHTISVRDSDPGKRCVLLHTRH